MSTSDTYSGFWGRLTYLVANAQMLVAGTMVSAAIAIVWFRPEFPGVPPIVMGWFAAVLLLGPPLFGFFVWLVHKLRTRTMVEVHHVDARSDTLEKYRVAPAIWQEKKVDGPTPYPVNGASGWAVQTFEWDEDLEQLRVQGVWLSEIEDTKLLTAKSHFEAIYGRLTESHIALAIFRDSVEQFGADIQHKLTNMMAEARERGKLMDPEAVQKVFHDFEDDAKGLGSADLPTLELDEEPTDKELEQLATEAMEATPTPDVAVAANGGTND